MFFRKKKRENADLPVWMPAEGGFETTRSRQLIKTVLALLEKKRTALMLAQKGGQPHPTILLGSTGKYLLIDAPADWKLKKLSVRIQFKDADLDCHFDTKIVYTKDEIIYTKMPDHLCRLQRRAHFRVEVPDGSQASFVGASGGGDRFTIRNISAGGMLCCSSNRQLARGTVLRDIDLLLTLAAGERGGKTSRITIPQARIVRAFDDRDSRQFCYGVAFECGGREESSLMAYIRQRELELAKAGAPA